MLHARDDYSRIQDPEGRIPADEPVFLLRAQDRTAPLVVQFWADLNKLTGDITLCDLAEIQARRMREWQETHGSKIADL